MLTEEILSELRAWRRGRAMPDPKLSDGGVVAVGRRRSETLGAMTSTALFTVAQARELMPEVHARAAAIIRMRADLAELSLSLRDGDESEGGVAEVKALEAHLNETVGWFNDNGIEVKGIAPLLIDFPSMIDGNGVRLCWLEGESALDWYHRDELGFAGRRRIDEAGES